MKQEADIIILASSQSSGSIIWYPSNNWMTPRTIGADSSIKSKELLLLDGFRPVLNDMQDPKQGRILESRLIWSNLTVISRCLVFFLERKIGLIVNTWWRLTGFSYHGNLLKISASCSWGVGLREEMSVWTDQNSNRLTFSTLQRNYPWV